MFLVWFINRVKHRFSNRVKYQFQVPETRNRSCHQTKDQERKRIPTVTSIQYVSHSHSRGHSIKPLSASALASSHSLFFNYRHSLKAAASDQLLPQAIDDILVQCYRGISSGNSVR